jgi:hypothetical protein
VGELAPLRAGGDADEDRGLAALVLLRIQGHVVLSPDSHRLFSTVAA